MATSKKRKKDHSDCVTSSKKRKLTFSIQKPLWEKQWWNQKRQHVSQHIWNPNYQRMTSTQPNMILTKPNDVHHQLAIREYAAPKKIEFPSSVVQTMGGNVQWEPLAQLNSYQRKHLYKGLNEEQKKEKKKQRAKELKELRKKEKTYSRSKFVRLYFVTDKDKSNMHMWFKHCIETYNYGLKLLQENKLEELEEFDMQNYLRENVITQEAIERIGKPEWKKTPKRPRYQAVKDLCWAFKSNRAKNEKRAERKQEPIKFQVKPKSQKRKEDSIGVEKQVWNFRTIQNTTRIVFGERGANIQAFIRSKIPLPDKEDVGDARVIRKHGRFYMTFPYKITVQQVPSTHPKEVITDQEILQMIGTNRASNTCVKQVKAHLSTLKHIAKRKDIIKRKQEIVKSLPMMKEEKRQKQLKKCLRKLKQYEKSSHRVQSMMDTAIAKERQGPKEKQNVIAMDVNFRNMFTTYSPEGQVLEIGETLPARIKQALKRQDRIRSKLDTLKALYKKNREKDKYKERGYKLYRRKRRRLNKAWRREESDLANFVKEFHFMTIRYLLSSYKHILLPKLNVHQACSKKGCLHATSKRVGMKLGHAQFRNRLIQKSSEFPGSQVYYVSEWGTTKTCDMCGDWNASVGGAEVFRCTKCAHVQVRDVHAARGIFLRNVL